MLRKKDGNAQERVDIIHLVLSKDKIMDNSYALNSKTELLREDGVPLRWMLMFRIRAVKEWHESF